MVDDVLPRPVEMGLDRRQIGIGLPQRVEQIADRERGRVVVELLELVPGLLHPGRAVGEGVPELLLERLDLGLDLLPGRLRELLELLGIEDPAVRDRREGEAHGRPHEAMLLARAASSTSLAACS